MLQKNKGQTAFAELERDLRKMIFSGELSGNTAIPTEAKLCKSYDISRNTARKALANLVAEGLLQKTQGRGIFVVPFEDRKSKSSDCLTIAAFVPTYNSSDPFSMYDRNLVSGFLECKLIKDIDIDLRGLSEVNLDKIIDDFYKKKINGIIWERPYKKYYSVIEKLRDCNVPQVTISRSIPGIPSLFFDGETSINETVDFLVSIGHKNIAFVDIDADYPIFKKRNMAFVDALQRNNIANPEDKLLLTKWNECLDFDDFFHTMDKKFTGTAIIAGNYFVESIFAWTEKNSIRIPEELTLISLSTSNAKELVHYPAISAIIEPRREIGIKAMELCKKLINGEDISILPEKINGELLIRKTCRPPRCQR